MEFWATVVIATAALFVAIYATKRPKPDLSRYVTRVEIREVSQRLDNLIMCTGTGWGAPQLPHRTHNSRILALEAELLRSEPIRYNPTLADRLAALEAKKGKK